MSRESLFEKILRMSMTAILYRHRAYTTYKPYNEEQFIIKALIAMGED